MLVALRWLESRALSIARHVITYCVRHVELCIREDERRKINLYQRYSES